MRTLTENPRTEITRTDGTAADATLIAAADRLSDEHQTSLAGGGRCTNPLCDARPNSCPAARASEHARRAATANWPQIWTARHDLASVAAVYEGLSGGNVRAVERSATAPDGVPGG